MATNGDDMNGKSVTETLDSSLDLSQQELEPPPLDKRGFSENCLNEKLAAKECIWNHDVHTCRVLVDLYKRCRVHDKEEKRLHPPVRRDLWRRFRSPPPAAGDNPEPPPSSQEE
jgi:hypothetical protein